jgi:hypothetical protein
MKPAHLPMGPAQATIKQPLSGMDEKWLFE